MTSIYSGRERRTLPEEGEISGGLTHRDAMPHTIPILQKLLQAGSCQFPGSRARDALLVRINILSSVSRVANPDVLIYIFLTVERQVVCILPMKPGVKDITGGTAPTGSRSRGRSPGAYVDPLDRPWWISQGDGFAGPDETTHTLRPTGCSPNHRHTWLVEWLDLEARRGQVPLRTTGAGSTRANWTKGTQMVFSHSLEWIHKIPHQRCRSYELSGIGTQPEVRPIRRKLQQLDADAPKQWHRVARCHPSTGWGGTFRSDRAAESDEPRPPVFSFCREPKAPSPRRLRNSRPLQESSFVGKHDTVIDFAHGTVDVYYPRAVNSRSDADFRC